MRRYLHADHQGSIVAISTGSGGTLLTANTCDAYGVRAETVRCYDERPDPTPPMKDLTPRLGGCRRWTPRPMAR